MEYKDHDQHYRHDCPGLASFWEAETAEKQRQWIRWKTIHGVNPMYKSEFERTALQSFEVALASVAPPPPPQAVPVNKGKGNDIIAPQQAPQQAPVAQQAPQQAPQQCQCQAPQQAPMAPWQWPQQAHQASGPPQGDIVNDAASSSTALHVTGDELVALHDKLNALTAQVIEVTAATASTTLQVAAQPEEVRRALHEKIDALTDLVTTAIPRLLALQEKQDAMMLKLEAVMVKLEAMDNTMNQNHTSPETMSQASSVAQDWTGIEQAQMIAPSGEEDKNKQQ